MTLLSLQRVSRSYGDLLLFSDVNLRIDERDRIGIIGDNGAGKTTLLRVLTGEDPPDEGERQARRDLRIVYSAQIPALSDDTTVLEAAQASFHELDAMEAELRALEAQMAEHPEDTRLHTRHAEIQHVFEASGGYHKDHRVEEVLFGLGFCKDEFDKPTDQLSGGQKARVALARVMLAPGDLLILDEPTNHLDLDGLAFLEDWLLARKAASIVVSHDRRFLDRVCESIVEVEGGAVTRYRGDYSAYCVQKERNLETALREYKKQADFIAKEQEFIRRHMGSRRTAEAKGRLKRLLRLERLAKPKTDKASMHLKLGKAKGLSGQTIVSGEALGFTWPNGTKLFENVDFRIFYGDRVCIVGRNGVGKSTLLRLCTGELSPTAGQLERAKKLTSTRFTQEMEDLPTVGTVIESMRAIQPMWLEGQIRDHLALFQFRADDVDKLVENLSGGEKRRLCLARLVTEPFDILLLDEPTNHLDITTREALEEALADYPGTIVMVSHDRYFLGRVATRIFELEPTRMRIHEHGLEQYEESRTLRRREESRKTRSDAGGSSKLKQAKVEPGQAAAKSPDKIRNPFAFQKLEEEIFALEEQLERIGTEIADPEVWKRPDRLKELQAQQTKLQGELETKYERWENWQ